MSAAWSAEVYRRYDADVSWKTSAAGGAYECRRCSERALGSAAGRGCGEVASGGRYTRTRGARGRAVLVYGAGAAPPRPVRIQRRHECLLLSAAVRRPPSTAHRPPSAVRRPPSTVRRPLSAVRRPPSAVRRPPSAVHRPTVALSAVHRPPSTVRLPPSAVHRPLSAVHRPPVHLSAVHRPPSTVRRPPSFQARQTHECFVFQQYGDVVN